MEVEWTLDELLDCAVAAVHAGGNHALENIDRRTDVVCRTAHDVKLRLDIECQGKAEASILERYPDHAILGEEDEARPEKGATDSAYEWIVDPIDGTVNFTHGLQRWCCAVAVRRAGRMLAGAVFAPELGELYTATADGPAACNGRPLRVSQTRTLAEAIVYTGLDRTPDPQVPLFEIFRAIGAHAQKTRVMGSAALDLCSVAAGRGDGYFESGIYTWDIAAAGLILERAGGRAEILETTGTHRLRYLAGNGLINEALKQVIERAR